MKQRDIIETTPVKVIQCAFYVNPYIVHPDDLQPHFAEVERLVYRYLQGKIAERQLRGLAAGQPLPEKAHLFEHVRPL